MSLLANIRKTATGIVASFQDGDSISLDRLAPSGVVQAFAGNTAPAGWLMCDGSAVSRTIYKDLFRALGTLYGVGDGSTTFNVPDLRGEFIRGADRGRGVDTAGPGPGPRGVGTTQSFQLGAHTHPSGTLSANTANAPHGHPSPEHSHSQLVSVGGIPGPGVRRDYNNDGSSAAFPQGIVTNGANAPIGGDNAPHSHPALSGSAGPAGAVPNSSEIRPRNVALNYIIKF
jgi:microcystin-dependent protein